MKINREDVVQAALTVERWCVMNAHSVKGCDCPIYDGECCMLESGRMPRYWNLEEHLRTRGLKHDD